MYLKDDIIIGRIQVNFTRNIQMTTKKVSSIANCVKILEDGKREFGSIPELHRALLRIGVDISLTALYNAEKGIAKSFKPDVVTAFCYLIYGGNWAKCGKALEADFLPSELKK
jgi:hypothetical protein